MIGELRPWLHLVTTHWPRHSHAFWEAEWLWLLKIEWGSGDKCNRFTGGNGVEGTYVAM